MWGLRLLAFPYTVCRLIRPVCHLNRSGAEDPAVPHKSKGCVELIAIALALDRFADDRRADGRRVHAVTTKCRAIPDTRLVLPDLRHEMACIGHEARPSDIDLEISQLWKGGYHFPAKELGDVAGVSGPGRDPSSPQQARTVLHQ